MNDAKRELLMSYIKSNVAPILVDFIDVSAMFFSNSANPILSLNSFLVFQLKPVAESVLS